MNSCEKLTAAEKPPFPLSLSLPSPPLPSQLFPSRTATDGLQRWGTAWPRRTDSQGRPAAQIRDKADSAPVGRPTKGPHGAGGLATRSNHVATLLCFARLRLGNSSGPSESPESEHTPADQANQSASVPPALYLWSPVRLSPFEFFRVRLSKSVRVLLSQSSESIRVFPSPSESIRVLSYQDQSESVRPCV